MEEENTTTNLESAEQAETTQSASNKTASFVDNPEIAALIELKVQEGIKKALQGSAPKAGTVNPTEQECRNFNKMTYRERLNLFNSDPHTYNKLAKGAI